MADEKIDVKEVENTEGEASGPKVQVVEPDKRTITKPISKVIGSLIYYNSLVRDTLEYALNKPEFNVDFFKYKQNGIINEPKLNSPLRNFINQNGENGEKLLERLTQFGETVYGENSTILHLANDGLRVDHGQNLALLEATMPIHDELAQIIEMHVNYAREHGDLEPLIEDIVKEDDRFYRGVAFTTINLELQKQFEEFNKIMNENKGQKSASSNFVEQELSRLVQLFARNKALAKCNDKLYTDALDALEHLIEMMNGKRVLPEGEKFSDVFRSTNEAIRNFVIDAEPKWKSMYQPVIAVLIDDSRRAQEAAANKVNPEA